MIIPLLLATTPLTTQIPAINTPATLAFEQPAEDSGAPATEGVDIDNSALAWGTPDTWRWGIVGGYGKDVKNSDNSLTTIGLEFEYFAEDDLSIDLGFLFMDVDQVGGGANGFNFTLQLRWHAVKRDDFSFFLEGGAGMLRTSENVPIGGSKFNFTPQAGLGCSFAMNNDARWLIGLRWHHISNANTYDTNPGRDSWQLWTGISFPF